MDGLAPAREGRRVEDALRRAGTARSLALTVIVATILPIGGRSLVRLVVHRHAVAGPGGNARVEQQKQQNRIATVYCARITPGGCQVPSPGGKMDGGGTLRGQYKRITR